MHLAEVSTVVQKTSTIYKNHGLYREKLLDLLQLKTGGDNFSQQIKVSVTRAELEKVFYI